MNEHVHPLFAGILQSVIEQPTLLRRAQAKAQPRRFAERPEPPSAFGELDHVGDEFRAGLDSVDEERDPQRELQDDMRRDMARRSA